MPSRNLAHYPLERYHLLPSVRGDLLAKLGRFDEARAEVERAAALTRSTREREVIDGPFTETKELIAGYTFIQVKSTEEALEWAKRFPAPHGERTDGEIEIRQLFELEDFGPSDAIKRFRDMGVGTTK